MRYCFDKETKKTFVIIGENKGEYTLESENKSRYIIRKSIFTKWFQMI